jgi:hypothetical protein
MSDSERLLLPPSQEQTLNQVVHSKLATALAATPPMLEFVT